MEDGTDILSPRKLRSFLGMVVYYQQYIEGCSTIAKPLFGLTTGHKNLRGRKSKRRVLDRRLTTGDWTPECRQAFFSRSKFCQSEHYWPTPISMNHFYSPSMYPVMVWVLYCHRCRRGALLQDPSPSLQSHLPMHSQDIWHIDLSSSQ